jgi:hypothetical protein
MSHDRIDRLIAIGRNRVLDKILPNGRRGLGLKKSRGCKGQLCNR